MLLTILSLSNNMELISVEESVIAHYKDGERVAATFFNGHAETHALDKPMGRKEYLEFFETNQAKV